MTFVIISLTIFFAYLIATYVWFGVPYSISDTFYKLENRKKGTGWLFTAMCWGVALPLLPALLDMTPDRYQITSFLACAGLLFVGAAPQFKLPLTNTVHYGSAAVCVVFSQVWVGLTCWWILLPVWIGFIVYILYGILRYSDFFRGYVYFKESKPMFWCEISSLATTYLTYILAVWK